MGSSSSKKQTVPVELSDGSVICTQQKVSKSKQKTSQAPCAYPCADPYLTPCYPPPPSRTHATGQPHGFSQQTIPANQPVHFAQQPQAAFVSPPCLPYEHQRPPMHAGGTYPMQPGMQPMYGGSMYHRPLGEPPYPGNMFYAEGHPYVHDDKRRELYREFASISGNQQFMSFSSFRLLFLAAICKVNLERANQLASETFARLDRNRDGFIDFNEFLNGYEMLTHVARPYGSSELSYHSEPLPHLFADSLLNAIPNNRQSNVSPYSRDSGRPAKPSSERELGFSRVEEKPYNARKPYSGPAEQF